MTSRQFYGKWAFVALSLFTSCAPVCQKWLIEKSITACPEYNSGKMYLTPKNEFTGLEVELLHTSLDDRMFINVTSFPFPNGENFIEVEVVYEDHSKTYPARILKGGQRLLLPADATADIINSLMEEKEVTIMTYRYESVIVPSNFKIAYQILQNIPVKKAQLREPPISEGGEEERDLRIKNRVDFETEQ